jgi:hypothetical protein
MYAVQHIAQIAAIINRTDTSNAKALEDATAVGSWEVNMEVSKSLYHTLPYSAINVAEKEKTVTGNMIIMSVASILIRDVATNDNFFEIIIVTYFRRS